MRRCMQDEDMKTGQVTMKEKDKVMGIGEAGSERVKVDDEKIKTGWVIVKGTETGKQNESKTGNKVQ